MIFWHTERSSCIIDLPLVILKMMMTHVLLFSTEVYGFVCCTSRTMNTVHFEPRFILFAKEDTNTPAMSSSKESLQKLEDDWEWDGNPIEGAHDSEFDDGSGSMDDVFMPSSAFMSMATSVTSPALSVIGAGAGDSSSNFDQKQNAGKLHLSEDDDFDLEEIGGDPGFLDDDDTGGNDKKPFESMQFDKEMDDDLFWDGLVDEDAHLDFD